jgi:hypothetical protein
MKYLATLKRPFYKIIILLLVLSSLLFVTGCYKSDQDLANENVALIVKNLKTRDADKIKSLFAVNVVKDLPNIDEDITDLLTYFKGDYISHRGSYFGSATGIDDGKEERDLYLDIDITTSIATYNILILNYRSIDDYDKNNIGVWRFCIVDVSDEINYEYVYWDNKDNYPPPGLYVGKQFKRKESEEEIIDEDEDDGESPAQTLPNDLL